MFDQFREKFHAVQQDLTEGIKSLSVKAQNVGKTNRGADVRNSKQDTLPGLRDGLHLTAGADLLDRFQGNWTKIHQDVEESSKRAVETDIMIRKIAQSQQKRLAAWQGIKRQLNDIPNLLGDIQNITAKIGNLAADFEEVESLLVELEDVLEEEEHQRNEQIQRQELEKYKHQKLYEEDLLKARLQDEFNEKLHAKQMEEDNKMRERQRAFQDFFDEDLKHYKEFGQMQRTSSVEASSPETHLGDLELEWDEHEQQALDDFLGPSDDPEPGQSTPQGPSDIRLAGVSDQKQSLGSPKDCFPGSSKELDQGPDVGKDSVPSQEPEQGQPQDELENTNNVPVTGDQSEGAKHLETTDRPNGLDASKEGSDVIDDISGTSEKVEEVAPSDEVTDGSKSKTGDIPETVETEDHEEQDEDSEDFQDAVDG